MKDRLEYIDKHIHLSRNPHLIFENRRGKPKSCLQDKRREKESGRGFFEFVSETLF